MEVKVGLSRSQMEKVFTLLNYDVGKTPANIIERQENEKWIIEQPNPDLSLKVQMPMLKFSYFVHIM